jgi:hypothetical protein
MVKDRFLKLAEVKNTMFRQASIRQQIKKLFTTVKIIHKNKSHIIALIAGKIYAHSALFMVLILFIPQETIRITM